MEVPLISPSARRKVMRVPCNRKRKLLHDGAGRAKRERLTHRPGTDMSGFKSDFLRVLDERGFIHQCSDPEGLDALCRNERVTAYIGFDATAPSLHVGSLVQIMMLHWLQKTGHRPIVLMGGGTTRVGDPSGKDEARRLLSDEQIAANLAGIRAVFSRFLRFGEAPADAVMANNDD